MQKPYTFIFVGRSGSGKGTQIKLLQEYIQKNLGGESYYFVMGDTFRNFMKDDGYAQVKIRETINGGNLIPDLITNSLFVSDILHGLKENQHLFIDGIPRSQIQSEAVIDILNFYNRKDAIMIDIAVSKDEVRNRMLSRKRPDDTEKAIDGRLAFYEKDVVPAVEYLKEKSGYKYIEIDGMPTIEEIHKDIINKLGI